ncbi:uncharacterized protein [Palaemon carinicauda]|uniref:uncharacterized protein isoform X2 n=1 Tax=Palaemon carinicauda TaxID=392227 RepID=UPI0035B62783
MGLGIVSNEAEHPNSIRTSSISTVRVNRGHISSETLQSLEADESPGSSPRNFLQEERVQIPSDDSSNPANMPPNSDTSPKATSSEDNLNSPEGDSPHEQEPLAKKQKIQPQEELNTTNNESPENSATGYNQDQGNENPTSVNPQHEPSDPEVDNVLPVLATDGIVNHESDRPVPTGNVGYNTRPTDRPEPPHSPHEHPQHEPSDPEVYNVLPVLATDGIVNHESDRDEILRDAWIQA